MSTKKVKKKKGEEKKEKKTRQGRMRKKGDLKISTMKSQYCE